MFPNFIDGAYRFTFSLGEKGVLFLMLVLTGLADQTAKYLPKGVVDIDRLTLSTLGIERRIKVYSWIPS